MEERLCPKCGKKVYSAATGMAWMCPHCGEAIPPGKEEKGAGEMGS